MLVRKEKHFQHKDKGMLKIKGQRNTMQTLTKRRVM